MKHIPLLLLFFLNTAFGQIAYQKVVLESEQFQQKINSEYADSTKSPLLIMDFKVFKTLPFYPIDSTFYVIATFEKATKAQPFEMKTTTNRRPIYEVYGVATFKINGKTYSLNIYQSHGSREKEEYKEYLFLPFTDLTNGETTYGGGRFIDLKIPNSNEIVINFNTAYNPYCAYSPNYSCPIPPPENFLDVAVTAGVTYKPHN